MNEKTIAFLFVCLQFTTPIQAQDTIYFDNDWKEATKDNHSFYRLMYRQKNGELSLVSDYYQEGIQKEEYEMKAGKRDGYRKIYEDGKLKYESIYKNDKIFSGKIRDGNDELKYVDGQLVERIVLGFDYDKEILLIENFENGQINSVEYFNFTIEEKPQESYKGKYKNGKPFQGYFANQIIADQIYLIDYFENGEIKYQYSFDIIEQLEGYRHYVYNQKAEFENGKVINGPEFIPPTKNGFLKINYKNGVADALEINLFAMHYFNRINLIRNEKEILVTEFQSPYKVKIFPKDSMITASLYEKGKLIKTKKVHTEVKEKSPNSITLYYLKNNQINTFSITQNQEIELDGVDANDFTFQIFSMFPIMTNSLDTVMNIFIDIGTLANFDQFIAHNQGTFFPFSDNAFLSSLEYDEKGNAGFGIKITQDKNGEILLEGMEDNKVKKSMKVKSIADLTANNKKIFEDFMHGLLNE